MADTLGPFEQAVLLAVVRLGAKAYGRAVHRDVVERLERDVAAGAVFSTLERLEKKRLLVSQLGPGGEERGRRPRRYYAVRPTGIQALNESRAMMDAIWHRLPKPLRGDA
jgi:PadR family transcriptional regulator PadR